MLSVLGRGLIESFTVFLLPISETFGWNRGRIISIYFSGEVANQAATQVPLLHVIAEPSGADRRCRHLAAAQRSADITRNGIMPRITLTKPYASKAS